MKKELIVDEETFYSRYLTAIEFLRSEDIIISRLIDQIGIIDFKPKVNLFEVLMKTIISQQLSTKAYKSIEARLSNVIVEYKPESILSRLPEEIMDCGVSRNKYNYIVAISRMVLNDELDLTVLRHESKEAIQESLIAIKGIGNWTCQIFMLSGIGKLDILPLEDVGIQNSIQQFYSFSSKPTKEDILKISKKWGDFSSVASLYLWKAYDLKLYDK